jgi:SAM-dependent methyltransferase
VVTDAIHRHFDDNASTWLERYRTRPSFRVRLQVVAATIGRLLAGQSDGARVLDVGSGPGLFGEVASAFASSVVCLDRSEGMLRAGSGDAGAGASAGVGADLLDAVGLVPRPRRVHRLAASVDALPFRAGTQFDLILAVALLEYLDDPAAVLAGLASCLAPDGAIVVTLPDTRSLVRRVERPVDRGMAALGKLVGVRRLADREYTGLRPPRSSSDWTDAVNRAGLVVSRSERLSAGSTAPRRWLHPNLLLVLTGAGAEHGHGHGHGHG